MGDVRIGSSPESVGDPGSRGSELPLREVASVADPSRQTASFPLFSPRSTGSIPARNAIPACFTNF